jgi:hypothetical protein
LYGTADLNNIRRFSSYIAETNHVNYEIVSGKCPENVLFSFGEPV